MVAITGLIAHTLIGTTWSPTSIARFFFQQETRRMNKHRINNTHNSGGAKDMVEAPPLAFIAVGATCAILSFRISCQIADTATFYQLQSRAFSIVVEIACYKNVSIRRLTAHRVKRLTQPPGHRLTERPAISFTTIAAGSMNHIDV